MPTPPVAHADEFASTSAPIQKLGYQPALDGLRACAVLAVMLYHGGVGWATGGYLGVDVFFVLSGFLITSLLLAEWGTRRRIDVLAFYGRRFRRLVPALTVVLLAVLVYGLAIAPSGEVSSLRGDLLATLGYATNWRFIFNHVGYFDAFALPSPLKHTWSLAVEEQWYLLWPMLLLAMLSVVRRRPHPLRFVLGVVLTLCVLSALLTAALFTPGGDPSRVYYGTDTRAQELLAGAALAILCASLQTWEVRGRMRVALRLAGFTALLFVFWMCTSVGERTDWLYRGGLLMFSFVVVLVIAAAIQPRGPVRTLLSPAPLRWVGAISYGLYLWHWPIYVYLNPTRTGLSNPALLFVRFVLTFAAASASFYLVERPVRERRIPRGWLLTAAPVTAAALVGGAFLLSSAPAPISAATSRSQEQASASSAASSAGPEVPRVAFTGDSVALTLSLGWDPVANPHIAMVGETILGCSLFDGDRVEVDGYINNGGNDCVSWREARPSWLQSVSPRAVIALSGVWETYDRIVDGRRLAFGTPAFDRWFGDNLDAMAAQFSSYGARTVFLTSPCYRRTGVNDVQLPENSDARINHLNDLYRAAAKRSPATTTVIDLHGFVCPNDTFLQTRDNVTIRQVDGVHFTREGAVLTINWLLPQIAAVVDLPPPTPSAAK